MRSAMLAAWTIVAFVGCPSPPPPPQPPPPPPVEEIKPDEPPEPEPLDAGMACVKAEAVCDAGICTADLDNQCESAVTCELAVLALCRTGSDPGEARGRARDTAPAGQRTKIEAAANCENGIVIATKADSLSCR